MQWNDNILSRKSGSRDRLQKLILSWKYWDKSIQITFQTICLVAYSNRTSYTMDSTREISHLQES
jgi:hypothetical protein